MRVLLSTAPLHGHFFPLVPLGWAFRALGHEVLVATSEPFVATAVGAGLPATATGPGIELGALADSGSAGGIADDRYAHGLVFADLAARHLPGMAALMDDWRPDVVVSERAEFAAPLAASARGIPRVELQWGVAELGEYRAAAEAVLRPYRPGSGPMPRPDLILDPWPASLRLPHALANHGLRHVPYNGVERVFDFASRDRPRVCLTLGTVLPHVGRRGMPDVVGGIVGRLAAEGYEIIVAMDDELVADLPSLPSAVLHAGRVPLSQTLRTCDVLVHHGGQGTSLTALACGRPQVVLPHFDDQLENADAVNRSGAGLCLPFAEATPERIAKYCRYVLDDDRFATAAAVIAREIAAQPSPVAVAEDLAALAAR